MSEHQAQFEPKEAFRQGVSLQGGREGSVGKTVVVSPRIQITEVAWQTYVIQDLAADNAFNVESFPSPEFASTWELKRKQSYSKFSKAPSDPASSYQRATNSFPLKLDSREMLISVTQVAE